MMEQKIDHPTQFFEFLLESTFKLYMLFFKKKFDASENGKF